jgi:hypothetical protein
MLEQRDIGGYQPDTSRTCYDKPVLCWLLSCRQIAEGILKQSGLEGYQLGTSKVLV